MMQITKLEKILLNVCAPLDTPFYYLARRLQHKKPHTLHAEFRGMCQRRNEKYKQLLGILEEVKILFNPMNYLFVFPVIICDSPLVI